MQGKRKTNPLELADHLYSKIPAFNDVFDEETFYVFAIFVVVGSFFMAFILSRFIKLKPPD